VPQAGLFARRHPSGHQLPLHSMWILADRMASVL